YGELGDHPKELEYYLKALKIDEIAYADNPNHPDLAIAYNNVGGTYGALGDYQRSVEYLLKGLEICKALYAEEPSEENYIKLYRTYANIITAYELMGDRERAIKYSKLQARLIIDII
ncbi:MAG: tetratricopeptide repeat protein, partial [Clostridia bacterium]|nr:tetratricopeptide repeat protein [Clostridia bacterium]